jgi:hypothetical protein
MLSAQRAVYKPAITSRHQHVIYLFSAPVGRGVDGIDAMA